MSDQEKPEATQAVDRIVSLILGEAGDHEIEVVESVLFRADLIWLCRQRKPRHPSLFCGGRNLASDEDCNLCGEPRRLTCKFCRGSCRASTAHRHDGGWVGDECCWDERLRSTE